MSEDNELPETCQVCHREVRVMAFRGTRLCSEKCRKALPAIEELQAHQATLDRHRARVQAALPLGMPLSRP